MNEDQDLPTIIMLRKPTLSSLAALPLLHAALFEGAALTTAESASKDNKLFESICTEIVTKMQKAVAKG